MPPTPLRIAQTSNEAKTQYKQNGPRLPDHQRKQLERGHELDVRAARLREAEDRRRAAKKKRDERGDKEKAARKQTGVGLATQLIGYSHTQAQLKSGMEAFLGLKRRNEEQQRNKDRELAKKLDEIAHEVEKEPWDDDMHTSFGEQYVDADLDDETLLGAHDLVMSDPIAPSAPQPMPPKDEADFTRRHGPINRAVESILDRLPEPLVELLSQDMSMKLPAWDPAPALLHKLNPLGLPPHRLRIKVGSIVSLLRDLNTSSQLSKSQHLRVLRVEADRLECLVLHGQLEGTKAFLTRTPFLAKFRNDGAYPFQRTQFPIRIATDYTKPSEGTSSSLSNRPNMASDHRSDPTKNASFKLPGLPASKSAPAELRKPVPTSNPPVPSKAVILDGWDDFLESGTQIARELSAEVVEAPCLPPVTITSASITQNLPPLSTQDFDFSIDDLEDVVQLLPPKEVKSTVIPIELSAFTPSQKPLSVPDHHPKLFKRKAYAPPAERALPSAKRPCVSASRPSVVPKLVAESDGFADFGISTQEVASFFDDDDDDGDDMFGGSPPITV